MSYASLLKQHATQALWWSCAVVSCASTAVVAQDDADFTYLLFDPVVIAVIETDASGEAPYSVQELSTLPQAAPAVDLREWLAQRDATLSLPPEALAADIAAYEQSVLELESKGGAFDASLDEELLALGSLLLQAGEPTRAQQVLERALHVSRVNDGLFNNGQLPIIERTIDAHLARGDLVAADAQQEYLLYIQRKNLNARSVDLLPALTRYAEWNLFAFGARLAAPASEATGDSAEPAPRAERDNMLDFRTGRLITAHQVYQTIISIVASNFGLSDSRLLNFERQLALTNYLYINTFGLEGELNPMMPYSGYMTDFSAGMSSGRPPLGFRQGRDSLERRVAYLASKSDIAPIEKALAQLDLADWNLPYQRMGSLELYQEIWNELAQSGTPATELDAVFDPDFPIEIPTYFNHAYTRKALGVPEDQALKYKGYIDVEFRLSRAGETSSIRIMNKSLTTPPQLESLLARDLRNSRFRPRIVDGTVRDNETMHVRFYFTY